jgi:hypothetical protein
MRIKVWAHPGAETPIIPDGPGVLDEGDVVEGVGVDGLATGRRGRRVVQERLRILHRPLFIWVWMPIMPLS